LKKYPLFAIILSAVIPPNGQFKPLAPLGGSHIEHTAEYTGALERGHSLLLPHRRGELQEMMKQLKVTWIENPGS
jgi:hypothetical protein